MKKAITIYLPLLFLVAMLIVLLGIGQKKHVLWDKNYLLENKQPYGLYLFDHEIDGISGQQVERITKNIYEYFKEGDSCPQQKSYLMINDNYSVSQALDISSEIMLMNAVSQGSTFFLSSSRIPRHLLDSLGVKVSSMPMEITLEEQTLHPSLVNPQFKNSRCSLTKTANEAYFSRFNIDSTVVLGETLFPNGQQKVTFIRVKYGQGHIFIHTHPSLFTNYGLLYEEGASHYVENLFSYIPTSQPIVWFTQHQGVSFVNTEASDDGRATALLSVIFRLPALRFCWLIVIYGLLLFVLFRAKRTQRVVPVIAPLQNTTVEFTKTIANLYYRNSESGYMMKHKIIYLLNRIRTQYHLDTALLDEAFLTRLSARSGKDRTVIDPLFAMITQFYSRQTADEQTLISFNTLADNFWCSRQETNV